MPGRTPNPNIAIEALRHMMDRGALGPVQGNVMPEANHYPMHTASGGRTACLGANPRRHGLPQQRGYGPGMVPNSAHSISPVRPMQTPQPFSGFGSLRSGRLTDSVARGSVPSNIPSGTATDTGRSPHQQRSSGGMSKVPNSSFRQGGNRSPQGW